MPTGYTAMIEDDDCTDAREYVKVCSRAFGLFMHQRDDSLKDEPKYPEPEDSYYIGALDTARVELAMTMGWDIEETEKAYQEYRAGVDESNKKSIARADRINGNYVKILNDLDKWEPFDEVSQNIKKFAVDQIEMCYPDLAYIVEPELDMDAWYAEKLDTLHDRVNYYLDQLEKERLRNIDRIKAIDTFFFELKRIPSGVDGVPEVW